MKHRFCHPGLVLLLAGLAAGEPLPDRDRLVEEFRTIAARMHYEPRPFLVAFNEILASASAGEGFDGTAARLQRALDIPPAAAVALARGVLRERVLNQRSPGTGKRNVTPEMVSAIEMDLRQAVDRAPCNRAALQALADFYNESRGQPGATKDYGGTLAQLVRPCPDSARTAEVICVAHTGDDKLLAALLPVAVAETPDHPAILHLLASRLYGSLARAPLSHAASRNLARLPETVDPRIPLELAQQEIDADLEAGLSDEAAAVYSSLPSSIQKGILDSTSSSRFDTELDGFAYSGWLKDLRLPLAAAFLLEGDSARARRFLDASTRQPPRQPGLDRTVGRMKAVLAEFLAPVSGEDRFDLISEAVAEEEMRRTLWSRVLARVALGADYSRVSVESLENAVERVGREERLRLPDFIVLPSDARTLSERFRGLLERLTARLTGELAEARRRLSEPVATDTMKPIMERLLESAPWNPYVEKPLPGGIEPVEISHDDAWRRLRDLSEQLRLPPNNNLIRADTRDAEIQAIVQPRLSYGSTDIGGTGYWWIRSSDAGRTWSKPLYLGLRGGRYMIPGFSNLPLVEDGRMQIEVEIWEKDPNARSFGMGTPRRKSGVAFLEAPLAAISQDTDGDGLTDLLEDALFLDPRRSDTDGDGFGDAEDSLPNVAFTRASSAQSRALAAFLEHMVGWSHRLVSPRRREPLPEEPLPDPSVLHRRMFVFVGNRSWFSGIEPTARIVVLTPEEWKSAGSRQDGVSPVFIRSFLLSKDRTRGVLRWSAAEESGTTRLEISANGEWTAVDIDRVII